MRDWTHKKAIAGLDVVFDSYERRIASLEQDNARLRGMVQTLSDQRWGKFPSIEQVNDKAHITPEQRALIRKQFAGPSIIARLAVFATFWPEHWEVQALLSEAATEIEKCWKAGQSE